MPVYSNAGKIIRSVIKDPLRSRPDNSEDRSEVIKMTKCADFSAGDEIAALDRPARLCRAAVR
jgi:hypothetical protein